MTTEQILKKLIADMRYYEKYLRGARFPGTREDYCDAILDACVKAEMAQDAVEREATDD